MSETLTTVILDGPLGKRFGRKWKLKVSSPGEALRLINANKPGLVDWIRDNLPTYRRYRVIVDKEERDADSFCLSCNAKTIRFVPLVEGAGGVTRFVIGAVMVVASFFVPQAWALTAKFLFTAGAGLMIGGAMEMLMSQPNPKKNELQREDGTSHYFSGPVNTDVQGVGIPLVYGTVLTGSHAVSASLDILKLDKPI